MTCASDQAEFQQWSNKMRSLKAALVFAALAVFMPALATSAEEAKGLPMVQGEIKKVDESAGKMTIKHAAIPNLSMDAMTMVFKAADPAMLSQVKPGDKIMFAVDDVNGQLTVMKLEKAK
jgi:Cu(I)/Ag(I) efflux system periplasmic protein CusF